MESVLLCLSRGKGFLLNLLGPTLQLTHVGHPHKVYSAGTPCGARSLTPTCGGHPPCLSEEGLGEHGAQPEGQAAQGTKEPQPRLHPDSQTQAVPGLPTHGQLAPQELPPGWPRGLAPCWRGIREKISSQRMAGPTSAHGNMAKPDLPAQPTLQRKITARASRWSVMRA